MEPTQELNLPSILDASHQNKWIAIATDYQRVVAAADSLTQLIRQVGGQDVIFHRVLPRNVSFVPASA